MNSLTQQAYLAGLNAEQEQAVAADRHAAIQVMAGAGTGKTELIARRFVKITQDLYQEGLTQPESRILVLTFTDAAAASMRTRIHNRLTESGISAGLPPNDWISTFHTFCYRLLVKHALESGLAPDFTILDELEKRIVIQRILTGIQSGDFKDISPVLHRFNLAHLPPDILSPEGLTRLGIRDTLALLERLPRLVDRIKASGLSPSEFLSLAQGQGQHLTDALKDLPNCHPFSKEPFDSLYEFAQVVKSELSLWAAPQWDPLQVDGEGGEPRDTHYRNQSLKFLLDYKPAVYLEYRAKGRKYLPVAEQDFSHLDGAHRIEQTLAELVAAFYAIYQHTLQLQNCCDFDDLINRTISLLQQNGTIQAYYQHVFQAIVVDEFQDTNGSQLKLLRLLMRPKQPGITVVGDEKQSIYGFRFAQPENMALVFQGYPVQATTLKINYRSLPPILAAANHITTLLCGDTQQCLNPSPKNEATQSAPVTWLNLGIDQVDKNGKTKPEAIYPVKLREARFIAQEIARLVDGGHYRYKDIAVLVKSHAKAELIQEALQELDIPSVRTKNTGFFHSPCIKDAMALMRLMVNLDDEAALVRLLQGKLNFRQLLLLARERKAMQCSLFQIIEQLENPAVCLTLPATVRQGLSSLTGELEGIYRLRNRLTPVQLFLKLSERIGLIGAQSGNPEQDRRTLRTFEKLLYHLCSESLIHPSLREVVDMLTTYQADPMMTLPVNEELILENAVQLTTIHGSKGLEYPVVFVAYTDMDQKRSSDPMLLFDPQYEGKAGFGFILGRHQNTPTLKNLVYKALWNNPRLEQEQKRLFYVALTRAQERLYVLRSDHAPDWTAAPWQTDLVTHYEESAEAHRAFFERYWPLPQA